MNHIKTYFEYKFHLFHQWIRKMIVFPEVFAWAFLINAVLTFVLSMYIYSMVMTFVSITLFLYCDYKRGDDIGWKRKKYKKGVTS